MVGNHIVRTARSAGFLNVEFLRQEELPFRELRATLIAGDELALACLFGILNVVYDVANGRTGAPSLPDMQRHQARGGHRFISSFWTC